MKITVSQLRRIIKEEVSRVLNESVAIDPEHEPAVAEAYREMKGNYGVFLKNPKLSSMLDEHRRDPFKGDAPWKRGLDHSDRSALDQLIFSLNRLEKQTGIVVENSDDLTGFMAQAKEIAARNPTAPEVPEQRYVSKLPGGGYYSGD
jgi:hypothetical protein